MKNLLFYFPLALIMVIPEGVAYAKPIDTIDSYGIYVVAEKGYVKIGSYSKSDRFVDFKHLHEIPYVTRGGNTLKLVVYEKGFNADSVLFELRPIDIHVILNPIKFDVKSLSKPDMYELTAEMPVPDGHMLQTNSYGSSFGVIMLGEPQAQLVKYFNPKLTKDPITVVQYVEDARAAFPTNTALKELEVHWQKAAKLARDNKGYNYVEEKWTQYQQAEKLALKARYLNEMLGEINGYLNEFPDGHKADEAKKRKAHAEEKLKEYGKLISSGAESWLVNLQMPTVVLASLPDITIEQAFRCPTID